ncbi:adenylate/guanylate cyclase domain-containing protein [Georgenia sp. M64]|uniref:adenylate/guanylate cyclase domain-containing protein n=1 Tax=Georgenia sp. M64 TaxID=3120520 RepID=UPI0030DEBC9F
MERIERRVVSVVFADLVGFTGLSENLDPEDVARVQEDYFARAAEVIDAHGGRTEKFIGDAVMATFGVQSATDDDAVAAVRAATGLVEAVRSLASDALGPLDLRVGVNTGEVAVSRAGSQWRVTGDVVNTAARLQVAAEPGEVLLGAETAFGVAHAYAVEPAGERVLRGRTAPVRVFRPGAPRPVPRGLAPHGLRAPTVGREEQLAGLMERLAAAGEASTGIVVSAPPGVGKSRLVEELAVRARAAGHPVLEARLRRDGDGYGAVATLLRAALAGSGAPVDDPGAVVARRLEEVGFAPAHARTVATHVADLLDGRALAAEQADLFASWSAALAALARTGAPDPQAGPAPLWLVEDAHLAGPDLRAFLAHLLGHVRGMVVLTSRPYPVIIGDPVLGLLPVLHLPPLPAAATSAMVEALVGRGTVPARYREGILAASGGNPLFVEELLRSWMLAGVLRPDEPGWRFTAGPQEPVLPTTVQAIYQAQLDRLAEGPRAVVEGGSVPGTTFPAGALSVLGIDDDATPALHRLTVVGLLHGPHDGPAGGASYTYRHALLRDTAYASLSRRRRAGLHARFARWVGEHGSGELVGIHLALALAALPATATDLEGRPVAEVAAEAAGLLERAAGDHLVSSPQRAAELLGRALAVDAAATPANRLRRTLAHAEALRRSGRLEEALRGFRDAGALARADEGVPVRADEVRADGAALVEAALGYENALFASRLPRAAWGEESLTLLRAALDALTADAPAVDPPAADPPAASDGESTPRADTAVDPRVRVLAALGRALVYSGRREEGVAAGTEAVRLAEAGDEPRAVAEAHLALRAGQDSPADLPARLAGIRRAVEAAERTGDDELRLEAARLELVDQLEAGDVMAADRAQARATDLAGELGRPLYLWYPAMWRSMRALLAGDHAGAPALVEAFADQGARSHYRDTALVRSIQLLELGRMTGDVAADLAAEIGRYADADLDRWVFARALVQLLGGDPDGARDGFEHYARRDFANVSTDLSRSTTLAYLAEVGAAVGAPEQCAALARELAPWAGHLVVLGSGALCLGAADHFLGLALRGAGETVGAEAHLRAAARLNDALGARALAARSRAQLTGKEPGT